MRDKLYEEALQMAVAKNFADVTTLLGWAKEANGPGDQASHVERAIDILRDVHVQLLDASRR